MTSKTHTYEKPQSKTDQTKALIQKRSQTLQALGHDIKLKDLYQAHAKESGFKDWDTMVAALKNQKPAEVEVLEAEVVELEGSDQTLCKVLDKDREVELPFHVMKYLGRLPAGWSDRVSRDYFLISILQLLRNEWKITEEMEDKWWDQLTLKDLPKSATPTKIAIKVYPASFKFTTNVALPPFSIGCRVRNLVLVDAMENLKIKSPNHSYDDYVVEDVKITKDGERWGLGS